MQDPFIKLPFAVSGDTVTIPVDEQPSGAVSMATGWTPDYQADPDTDPVNYKPVERAVMNELFRICTTLLRGYQTQFAPEYIDAAANSGVPFAYAPGVFVRYTDPSTLIQEIWVNMESANTKTPSVANGWKKAVDGLNIQNATDTISGITRYATPAEVAAGSLNTAAVTPFGLSNAIFAQGQQWKDVKSSRALGVTYTNSSSRPIAISVSIARSTSDTMRYYVDVNGVNIVYSGSSFMSDPSISNPSINQVYCIIPAGATYKVYVSSPGSFDPLIQNWFEL